MPFFGAEYNKSGFDTPCCLMAPSDRSMEQIREDFINDVRPRECNKCWANEDLGLESDRQLKNQAYDFYADRDIKFVKKDCAKGLYSQQIVKLYTSNICNSTCVTCNATASSAWAALDGKHIEIKKIPDHTLSGMDLTQIKMLTFVGGEPLYEKLNFEILEQLIHADNTDCFISMVTNGSTKINQRQIDILSKFKNLNFCLSIDGVGSVFEYLRYPLKWNVLLDNIVLYRSLGIQLSVSYTISNLNVLYHKETIEWFNDNHLQFNHNVVYYPEYFHPDVLAGHPLADQCIAELRKQDKLKGIDARNYIPRFIDSIQMLT